MQSAPWGELLQPYAPICIPAMAGFIGVLAGAWLTSRREEANRRMLFLQKQISDLYSPLLGLRTEIRMLTALRLKISSSADVQWRKLCKDLRECDVDVMNRRLEEERPNYHGIIEYNNKQLTEFLLPSYRKMADLLRDNYYLAEAETREHYAHLIEYVDLWDRWIGKCIPTWGSKGSHKYFCTAQTDGAAGGPSFGPEEGINYSPSANLSVLRASALSV